MNYRKKRRYYELLKKYVFNQELASHGYTATDDYKRTCVILAIYDYNLNKKSKRNYIYKFIQKCHKDGWYSKYIQFLLKRFNKTYYNEFIDFDKLEEFLLDIS